jgi:hypothetical protein
VVVYGARLHGCASARTDPCIAVDMAFNSLQSILLCESPITVHNEGNMLWHGSAPLQQSSRSAACCWWRQLWPPHDGRGDDEQKSSLHIFYILVARVWRCSSPQGERHLGSLLPPFQPLHREDREMEHMA